MQIGSLTAFLTYLIQILMSVMMATFLLMIAPRAAVCAERIEEVLDTDSSVVPPEHPVDRRSTAPAWSRSRRPSSPTRAPTHPVLSRHQLHRPPGPDHGDHRVDRLGQDDPDLPDPAAVRRHRRVGQGRRGRGPRHATPTCCGAGSAWYRRSPSCSPAPSASNLRYGKPGRHRRRALARARGRPGRGLRPGDARAARRTDRPGRHQRLGRSAPAALDRPGAGQEAGDLRLRRLVLRPRRRHRRPAARRAARRRPATPR